MTFAIFQPFRTTPVLRELSKRIGTNKLCISFKTLALLPSGLVALWILRFNNSASVPLVYPALLGEGEVLYLEEVHAVIQ